MKHILFLLLVGYSLSSYSQTFLNEKTLHQYNDSVLYKKTKKLTYSATNFRIELNSNVCQLPQITPIGSTPVDTASLITKTIDLVLIPRDVLEFLVVGISGYVDEGVRTALYSNRRKATFGKISNVALKRTQNIINYYAISFIKWYDVEDLFTNYETLTLGGDCDCDIAFNMEMILYNDGNEIKAKYYINPKQFYLECGAIFCEAWGIVADIVKAVFEFKGQPIISNTTTLFTHAGVCEKINNAIQELKNKVEVSNEFFNVALVNYQLSEYVFTNEGLKTTITYTIQIQ